MVELTRIKGETFVLNSDQIEMIESTPDTVVTMLNGHRYIVKEPTMEIIKKIAEFRRSCVRPQVASAAKSPAAGEKK